MYSLMSSDLWPQLDIPFCISQWYHSKLRLTKCQYCQLNVLYSNSIHRKARMCELHVHSNNMVHFWFWEQKNPINLTHSTRIQLQFSRYLQLYVHSQLIFSAKKIRLKLFWLNFKRKLHICSVVHTWESFQHAQLLDFYKLCFSGDLSF